MCAFAGDGGGRHGGGGFFCRRQRQHGSIRQDLVESLEKLTKRTIQFVYGRSWEHWLVDFLGGGLMVAPLCWEKTRVTPINAFVHGERDGGKRSVVYNTNCFNRVFGCRVRKK